MDLHPISPVEFDWALITGYIGWKFIEITLYPCLVELGISVNSTSIYLSGFTPYSTGQIRLVELGVNPLPVKGFRSQWIYTQFDWSNWV